MRRVHESLLACALAGCMLFGMSSGCAQIKPQAQAIAQDVQPYLGYLNGGMAVLCAALDAAAPYLDRDTMIMVGGNLVVLQEAIQALQAANAACLTDNLDDQWRLGYEAAANAREALVAAGVTGI